MTALQQGVAIPFIHPADMPDRYALAGVGTCMAPLVNDGDCLAFDKRLPVEPGDLVGVIFTQRAGMQRRLPGLLKRLVSAPPEGFDGPIILEQMNPPRRLAIASTDVLAIHKMIGIAQTHPDGRTTVRLAKQEPAS